MPWKKWMHGHPTKIFQGTISVNFYQITLCKIYLCMHKEFVWVTTNNPVTPRVRNNHYDFRWLVTQYPYCRFGPARTAFVASTLLPTKEHWLGSLHKPWSFWDQSSPTPIQSSVHNDICLVKVTQVFAPAYFSRIQHIDYKKHLFAYHLVVHHCYEIINIIRFICEWSQCLDSSG